MHTLMGTPECCEAPAGPDYSFTLPTSTVQSEGNGRTLAALTISALGLGELEMFWWQQAQGPGESFLLYSGTTWQRQQEWPLHRIPAAGCRSAQHHGITANIVDVARVIFALNLRISYCGNDKQAA